MPEYLRKNSISEDETPIDSSKYNEEIDNIYAILNALEGMAIGATPPSVAANGKFWLDTGAVEAPYSVPMLRIYRTASGAWEWTGVSIETSKPSGPRKGAIHYTVSTGVLEIYTGSAWVQFATENNALYVSYDNSESGLTAATVQAAIDELLSLIPDEADLSGLVTKATLNAQSVLGAVTDDTPVAIVLANNQLLGRAGGNVTGLTVAANSVVGRAAGDITAVAVGEAELLGRSTGGALASLAKAAVKTILGFIESLVEDTTPQLGGDLDCNGKKITDASGSVTVGKDALFEKQVYFSEINDDSNTTIDWTAGLKHKKALSADVTLTFTPPTGPTHLVLRVVQNASAAKTITWPATVKFAYTPSYTGLSKVYVFNFYFNGTNYLGSMVGPYTE